jgi:hypothetical protein
MDITLTDEDIERLVHERKVLPAKHLERLALKQKRGNYEAHLEVAGETGGQFRIIVRQLILDPFDFSVILAYRLPHTNKLFRLRRYNGRHGEHTNRIEGIRFSGTHVHKATARYQDRGMAEEAFAEPTDRYSNLHEAIDCLIADCGFEKPPDPQGSLF